MIKRDGEELLDVLAAVETDHCDEDTFLLVLVESVHNEQLLVAERHSVLVALLWELYLPQFAGNDLDMVILKKNIHDEILILQNITQDYYQLPWSPEGVGQCSPVRARSKSEGRVCSSGR